jgi:hypothetical protein
MNFEHSMEHSVTIPGLLCLLCTQEISCDTFLVQGPWVVVPHTAKAAVTLSALVRAAAEKRMMAVVRFGLIASSSIAVGVMLPIVGSVTSEFDHFQLYKLAWGSELRSIVLPENDDAMAVRSSMSGMPRGFHERLVIVESDYRYHY